MTRVEARLLEAERLLRETQRDLMRLNRQVSTFGMAATILSRIDAFLAGSKSHDTP